MNMFQGGLPPNYLLDTSYMQCGCGPKDPFANMDPKTRKIANLVFVVNYILQQDYSTLKQWQVTYENEFAVDEFVYLLTKKLMEMSEDEFAKYQEYYREEVRRSSEGGDKPSDPDGEKGSGEGNETILCENRDSNR